MRFKVIVTTWNAEAWIERCLRSIADQDDGGMFDVAVVVDKSSDDTAAVVKRFSQTYADANWGSCWTYILRDEKARGVIENQLLAIEHLRGDPEDVFVWVDGDDYLAHDRVFARLRDAYADGTTLLTYGSYRSEPFSPTCAPASAYPSEVVRTNGYRRYAAEGKGINWNHLRTVKKKLVDQLDASDFRGPDDLYLQSVADAAIMFPCLELARGGVKFISEVLLVYNSENPSSEWRVRPKVINNEHEWILSRQPKC